MAIIALIRPPGALPRNSFTSGVAVPPLGMAYLIATLEESGHDVVAVDAIGEGIDQFRKVPDYDYIVNGLTPEEIIARIPPNADLIGFSLMFSNNWFYSQYVIKRVKARFPFVPVVVGGEHATADWESILATTPEVDYCVIGEGEETLAELLTFVLRRDGSSPESISGLAFRKDGRPARGPKRERIRQIDELPLPSWEKIPIENYLQAGYAINTLGLRTMPILASRGCPYRCTFCTSPQMWGTELRLRDPARIVEEIKLYISRYKIDHVDFYDLVGVIHREWTTKLLKLMIQENLGVTWMLGAGTRSEVLSDEILELFKQSNVLKLIVSPETGSRRTAQQINKRLDPDRVLQAVKKASSLGIITRANIILGFPGQTLRDYFATLLYTLKLTWVGIDDITVNIFVAYPGSALHRELTEKGKIPRGTPENNRQYQRLLTQLVTTKFWGQLSWSEHIPAWSVPWLQLGTMMINYVLWLVLRPHRIVLSVHRALVQKRAVTIIENVLYRCFIGMKHGKTPYRDLPAESTELKTILT